MEIGEAVFGSDGELADDFQDKLEMPFGDHLLILSELELEPRWRGLGLGPVIAGLVLESLQSGAVAIVCKPAPLHQPLGSDGQPRDWLDEEWDEGVAKLSRLWGTLGFEPHRGGVHFIDPRLRTFMDSFASITKIYLAADELSPGVGEPRATGLRLVQDRQPGER
jgi:hypothetical protein